MEFLNMNPIKLLIVDIDSLFDSQSYLNPPQCNLLACDRGNFRDESGQCQYSRCCSHSIYRPGSDYHTEQSIETHKLWSAVIPALHRINECGWLLSFWTTRPRHQTFKIIQTLKKTGIWYQTLWFSGTSLLLSCPESRNYNSAIDKLSLFEKVYGELFSLGEYTFCFVESDPVAARIIRSYLGDKTPIKLAPKVWLEVLVNDDSLIDSILTNQVSFDVDKVGAC
jgi:hypothetical protein